MSEPAKQQEPEAEEPAAGDDKWYSWFGYAALFFAISGFLWWYFTDFETKGGSRRIHWVVALLYNAFGKTVTVSIFGVIGAILLAVGVMAFMKRKR